MEPKFEQLTEKLFVGVKMIMSFTDNKIGLLWQNFMPKRKDIKNTVGSDLYSIELYGPSFFDAFDPTATFEKWAAVEVSQVALLPDGLETIVIPGGLYAVFTHRGPASLGSKTYEYVLSTWIPNSDYELDARPHFWVMGEKYKNNDPNSEETLWVPISPMAKR